LHEKSDEKEFKALIQHHWVGEKNSLLFYSADLFNTTGWKKKNSLPSTMLGRVEEEGSPPFSTWHGQVEEGGFSPCLYSA